MIRRAALAVAWLAVTALIAPVAPVAEAPPAAQQDPAPLPAPQEEATTPPAPATDSPVVERQPVPDAPPAAPSVQSAPASDQAATSAPAATPSSQQAPTAETEDRQPVAVAAASGSVTIEDFSFGPSSVTVGVGETVTWSNAGPSEHTATATDGSFDTGLLSRNESGSATFDEVGTFSYLCEPHPFMKGTVRVVAQTSDDSEGTGSTDGTGTGDGVAGATESQPDGAQLPSTGAHPAWLAITGLGLLLIGATGLRRGRGVGAS